MEYVDIYSPQRSSFDEKSCVNPSFSELHISEISTMVEAFASSLGKYRLLRAEDQSIKCSTMSGRLDFYNLLENEIL